VKKDTTPETMYLELDAVLSFSTLLLLLKPQKQEKLEAKLTKPKEETSQKPEMVEYFDPVSDIIVVAPCSNKYEINTLQGRIPGILL
jgi:hypothetical protein